jgi:hypothetical protein
MITKEQVQEAFKTIDECKKLLNEYQQQLKSELLEVKKAAEAHGPYLVHESDSLRKFLIFEYMGDFEVRAHNLIRQHFDEIDNPKTIGDFMRLTDNEVLQWSGAGRQTLNAINRLRSEIVLR